MSLPTQEPTQEQLRTETVLMHGPNFDGSGEILEQQIAKIDVNAFKRAGWVEGANPTKTFEEAVEEVVEKVEKKKSKK